MKRTKRTLLICLILILGLCCIGADALEQTIRVRLPVDVNTGELKANSFAYREGSLLFIYQDKLCLMKKDEVNITEFVVSDLIAENLPEHKNLSDKGRYKLLPSASTVSLLDVENGYLYSLDADNENVSLRMKVSLMWQDYVIQQPDGTRYVNAPSAYCLTNEALYALGNSQETGKQLVSFSLADGSKKEHEGIRALAMTPHQAEDLLLVTVNDTLAVSVQRWHDGKAEPWADLADSAELAPSAIFGMVYDGHEDKVYMGVDSQIRLLKKDGSMTVVAELPESLYLKEEMQMADRESFALMSNVGVLECKIIGIAGVPERSLTLWGNAESPEIAIASLSIPGLRLQSVESDNYEVLLQQLISRSETVDIYRMSLPYVDFKALRDKGFFVDLSSSKVLQGFFEGLYPNLQRVLGDHGMIAAIPIRAEMQGNSLYDQTFFDSEKLSVPTTFEEMCGIISDWPEKYAHKHDDLRPFTDWQGARRSLIQEAVEVYQVQFWRENGMDHFDSDLLRRLLTAAERAADETVDNPSGIAGKEMSVFWIGAQSASIMDYRGGVFDGRRRQPLFLSADKGQAPAMYLRIDVLTINPFSPNKDSALQFLEKVSEALPMTLKLMLSPDINEPIENPHYHTMLRQKLDALELVKAQVKEAGGANKTLLEERQSMLEQDLEEYQKTGRFLVSAEDISVYRQIMADPVIEAGGAKMDLRMALKTPLLQFADKSISMDQFIREAERKWQLIRNENR